MTKKPLIFGSGLSSYKDVAGLTSMCATAIDNGIMAFDTAPSYRTEEMLSQALHAVMQRKGIGRSEITIQTKIDPIQMYNGNIRAYFEDKLLAMKLDYVDALLIHWPVCKYFKQTWKEIQKLKKAGLTRRTGICNLRIEYLRELKSEGIVPEVLQIERHPLNTFMDEAVFCRNNGIELQDYSPLCKMHPQLSDSQLLKDIARKYNRSVGLIILRWHIDTGAIPVFTSKKASRIEEYADIDSFMLSDEDCALIASLNVNHKLYLESLICPGF